MQKELKTALSSLPTYNPDLLYSYPVLFDKMGCIMTRNKKAKPATARCKYGRREDVLLQNFLHTNSFLASKGGKRILNERANLPILRSYNTILEEIMHNTVTIVSGSTGCGKSTQLPQFILDNYMKKKAANLPLPTSRPPHIIIAEVCTAPSFQT